MTLVPDSPDQITSNSGWDTKTNFDFLSEVLDEFNNAGIRTSVFVSADIEMVEYAAKAGPTELNYTLNRMLRNTYTTPKRPYCHLSKQPR